MAHWMRFEHGGETKFGALRDGVVAVHEGDMFAAPKPTGESVALDAVRVLTPCQPSKMICLWNNFHELAAKNNFQRPEEPLYFIKAANAYHPHGEPIRRPKSFDGKIVYEGELGIVIGRRCVGRERGGGAEPHLRLHLRQRRDRGRPPQEGPELRPMGARQELRHFRRLRARHRHRVDPMTLRIRTVLNGKERQNYPVSDMFFPPAPAGQPDLARHHPRCRET